MAGYVPLSARVWAFITLAITALFYFSLDGVLDIYARLYILSAALTPFLKTAEEIVPRTAMKNKMA
ncbi:MULTISPECIES: hypothetical protein [Lonsdalea]|uniref:Uncharacterized protein n=3 Tax=Lonsdalea TaxID=1082702 RepID=A0ACD1JCL1_9GAMM|nr:MULTISPECIES: hypothetical protein [Lonsdalea]RAT13029.1 hypothetical protein AU486_15200 [Lonsdalea quercina]RAT13051.1 hypothetical protein AU485_09970 [Lonsdalea quercina]RAT20093.1 hypothetical protein AU489_16580 [Lonsdalea populi]RAT20436.1 hypothetical protein AU487_07925 [Lonsdalea populi]RAT20816.1 hypothetical protein AU488_13605 [Lonsdalea populi]